VYAQLTNCKQHLEEPPHKSGERFKYGSVRSRG